MKILESVPFSQVLNQFRAEHPTDDSHEWNTNSDGEAHLLCAQRMTTGWARVLLTREEVQQVVLPWHESEGGDLKLVPKCGLTVAGATDALRGFAERYPTESPICWSKIARMSAIPRTPLYLSTTLIDMSDYEEIVVDTGLVHLDGLHRMVAWELHGVLAVDSAIEAYLAGVLLS